MKSTRFRADYASLAAKELAVRKFAEGLNDAKLRKAAAAFIDELIAEYGPVVSAYPSWHPFSLLDGERREVYGYPALGDPVGFVGLDHNLYFRDAFLTAPYGGADRVIESANERRSYCQARAITEVKLYHHDATPVLVWYDGMDKAEDDTISKREALGRMLAYQLPAWEWADCAETWETMRRYLLGCPCGKRSSLFVNQETGSAMKEVYETLNSHGLFGPMRKGAAK